ncbi:hypothetical protein [Aquimarina rhabdastrellae]
MSRKLILTPYEHGFLAALHHVINESELGKNDIPVDIPHLLLSALTMAGVDNIQSSSIPSNTETKLITKIDSQTFSEEWSECSSKIRTITEKYISEKSSEETKEAVRNVSHRISQLFYAMQTNSGILTFSPLNRIDNKEVLPLELIYPIDILYSSVQTRNANLPIVKLDLEKKEFKRLIDILESKEFSYYKEAQSEIELNKNLTIKTVKLIEKAGKDLYTKNSKILNLRENLIKAIPLSSKVIDLFFGKLPGMLTEHSGKILTDYLKLNKTIPIYNCDSMLTELVNYRLKKINPSK